MSRMKSTVALRAGLHGDLHDAALNRRGFIVAPM